MKSNRLVNPDDTGNVPVARLAILDTGCVVHLMGYGFVVEETIGLKLKQMPTASEIANPKEQANRVIMRLGNAVAGI